MSTPLDFLEDGAFRAGLAAGLLVAVTAALTTRCRPPAGAPAPVAVGVPAVAMAMVVMAGRFGVPVGLVAGLALLAAAAPLRRRSGGGLASAIVAVVGAWLVGWQAGGPPVTWIQLLVAASTLAGGAALADLDARWRGAGLAPALLGLTAVGIYYTVPDTREALVLMGVALPLAAAGGGARLVRLGAGGSLALAGLVAWVVAVGGHGRQSAVVGGIACLGLAVLEPAGRRLRRGRPGPLEAVPWPGMAAPALALVHLGFVVVASRVAGLRSPEPYQPGGPEARGGVAVAVAVVAGEILMLVLLWALAERVAGRRRPARNVR